MTTITFTTAEGEAVDTVDVPRGRALYPKSARLALEANIASVARTAFAAHGTERVTATVEDPDALPHTLERGEGLTVGREDLWLFASEVMGEALKAEARQLVRDDDDAPSTLDGRRLLTNLHLCYILGVPLQTLAVKKMRQPKRKGDLLFPARDLQLDNKPVYFADTFMAWAEHPDEQGTPRIKNRLTATTPEGIVAEDEMVAQWYRDRYGPDATDI